MTTNDISAAVRDACGELKSLGVARLRLFGSRARGDAREDSDIDFLVEFVEGRKNFDAFMSVAEVLEARFPFAVDLLTPEAFDQKRRTKILQESVAYEIDA